MSTMWQNFIRPLMFRMEAEQAHDIGIKALRSGFAAKLGFVTGPAADSLKAFGEIERFGLRFANPLGMAAGFDKNGIVVDQLADIGFGFVEVGTVTFEPQPGNPKPRLFRLPADQALINRLGFNNDGAVEVAERLSQIARRCVVGVNIGRNKDVPNEEATENYLKSFELVHPLADYVAVNISSPNTPNLRELQRSDSLDELIGSLQKRNRDLVPKPLVVKIAPDLTESEIESIVDIALRHQVSGIIATNTTVSRDGLKSPHVDSFGAGGLSGKPLQKRSNEVVSKIYKYSKGRLPIIGVGGIFSAEDAFEKIAAGACLLQAYTGFIYAGPAFAGEINRGLARLIEERGFADLDQAIGSQSGETRI